jgi:dynein heavy chain
MALFAAAAMAAARESDAYTMDRRLSGARGISRRVLSHFLLVAALPLSDADLVSVFSAFTSYFLKPFPMFVSSLGDAIVRATVGVMRSCAGALRAVPLKPHYEFSANDVSRVIQGVVSADAAAVDSPDTCMRLWLHELTRVFQDRLVDDADRALFKVLHPAAVCAPPSRMHHH